MNEFPRLQASRRKLAPARKYSTPQELLMQSIRSSSVRDSLRKSAPMTNPTSSLSRAVLDPEFPEEEERIKKGKLVRERSHISHIILDKWPLN